MWSRRSAASDRLAFTLGASRLLALLLAGIHLGAVVALALVPLDAALCVALLPAIGFSLVSTLRVHAFRSSASAITRVEFNGERCAVSSEGREAQVCAVSAQFVHSWFVVLRLKPEEGRELSLAIARDALDADSFRALRARLNLARTPV